MKKYTLIVVNEVGYDIYICDFKNKWNAYILSNCIKKGHTMRIEEITLVANEVN